VQNLRREGIDRGVHLVGDTMYDATVIFGELARSRSSILLRLNLSPGEYYLATVHRPYNTDNPSNLTAILRTLSELTLPVVLPVHPRTRARLAGVEVPLDGPVRLVDPVGYLDMLALEQHARVILTDSGGVQKEAFFLRVPCVTLRSETEWVETVEAGWNIVVGADPARILAATAHFDSKPAPVPSPFGDGHASERIAALLSGSDKGLQNP
jgi:UDP-N-acetylglucosamine 2-epimerase